MQPYNLYTLLHSFLSPIQARLRQQLEGVEASMQLQQEHAEQALADANTRSQVGAAARVHPFFCVCGSKRGSCWPGAVLQAFTQSHPGPGDGLLIASYPCTIVYLPLPMQGLEEELATMQSELRSCCTQMAAAERQAATAAAEAAHERQRRQEVEQQLLAAQQSVER